MSSRMFMARLSWPLLLLPLQVLTSDHGVLIFGGEGPDGPVDTVSVLTEQGWCPQEHVLLPSLPLAASHLSAYHGYETEQGRPFIVVCGFPGDQPCYYTTLTNPVWQPMGLYEEDINLAELEFVTMFANYMGGGLKSMWRNKTSGMYSQRLSLLVFTAQLQLQLNLSWCDTVLTFNNNSSPLQLLHHTKSRLLS